MEAVRHPPEAPVVLEELLDKEHLLEDVPGLGCPVDDTGFVPPLRLLEIRASVACPLAAFLRDRIELEPAVDGKAAVLPGLIRGHHDKAQKSGEDEG